MATQHVGQLILNCTIINVGLVQALQNHTASKTLLFENVLKRSIFRMFLISQLSDTHVIRISSGQFHTRSESIFHSCKVS